MKNLVLSFLLMMVAALGVQAQCSTNDPVYVFTTTSAQCLNQVNAGWSINVWYGNTQPNETYVRFEYSDESTNNWYDIGWHGGIYDYWSWRVPYGLCSGNIDIRVSDYNSGNVLGIATVNVNNTQYSGNSCFTLSDYIGKAEQPTSSIDLEAPITDNKIGSKKPKQPCLQSFMYCPSGVSPITITSIVEDDDFGNNNPPPWEPGNKLDICFDSQQHDVKLYVSDGGNCWTYIGCSNSIYNNNCYSWRIPYNLCSANLSFKVAYANYPSCYDTDGTYQVIDPSPAGCSTNLAGKKGESELVMTTTLTTFPNPAKDVVNVSLDTDIETIVIYDLQGRTVQSIDAINSTQYTIDIANLNEGAYFIRVNDTEVKRFLKQ